MPGGRPEKPDAMRFHIHSIRFPNDLWAQVTRAAKAKGQTRARFIREAITEKLDAATPDASASPRADSE
jgi:predicted transcriptional regulator